MENSKVSYESLRQDSRGSLDYNSLTHNEHDRKHQRRRYISLYHISILNACLLLVVISLLTWNIARTWRNEPPEHNQERFIERTYGSNENYMSLDHETDYLWETSAIKRAGVITLSRDDKGGVTEIGAITMFHQLHCLVTFRRALQKAYEGGKVAFDFREDHHWPHCLYYLREAIICQADGQIEEQQFRNDSRASIDGSGDLRKCRDANILFDLYDERKANQN